MIVEVLSVIGFWFFLFNIVYTIVYTIVCNPRANREAYRNSLQAKVAALAPSATTVTTPAIPASTVVGGPSGLRREVI